jgi:hypothetical protein
MSIDRRGLWFILACCLVLHLYVYLSYASHSHPKITHIYAFATVCLFTIFYQASLLRSSFIAIVDVKHSLLVIIYMFILSTFLVAPCNQTRPSNLHVQWRRRCIWCVSWSPVNADAVNLMAPFRLNLYVPGGLPSLGRALHVLKLRLTIPTCKEIKAHRARGQHQRPSCHI